MPKPSPNSTSETDKLASHAGGAATESVPPKRRRTYTAAYKLSVVQEADACTGRGDIEALLRREGLYSSHLSTWRQQLRLHGSSGMATLKRGRKPKYDSKESRIQELEKRNAKLERELHVARALLDLQKKASEILGIALPPPPDGDES